MTSTEPDTTALKKELNQIKEALGLAEEYPYWWRWWAVEGVGVGIMFPIIQVGINEGFSPSIISILVIVFVVHQLLTLRILRDYERPSTGIPSWTAWNAILVAGVVALTFGFTPFFDEIAFENRATLLVVFVGSIAGVCYLFMGRLLHAYHIRKADRYSFYVGGVWILFLVALLPQVTLLQEWVLAVFGIGIALHCIASYVALSLR